ncbi:MAG: 2Fe-2S iron-sulfur cluster-binding protein [Burkholderiales bacterium]
MDGLETSVSAEPGDTILDALLMAGVGFPYSCQAGNCGTCKCELLSGEVFELEYSEHALAPTQRARNIVLACRSQVWSDVRIRRLVEEDLIVHPSRVMRCRVTALDRLTHDIWRLRLDIESGGPYTFSAGQYASIEFPFAPGLPRDYSMANRPDESVLEFHIREMPQGAVSAGLGAKVKRGDTVRVSGPLGSAYLREAHAGPVIAIAGGSGLAPIRSILSTMRLRGGGASVHAYLGVRSERDVYGEAELEALVGELRASRVHVVLSDASSSSANPTRKRRIGLVTDAVNEDFDRLDGFVAYLAGPPPMVEAAVTLLESKGVARRDIHADAFYPAGLAGRARDV